MGINWDAVFVKVQKSLHHLATVGVNLKYDNETAVIPTTSSSSGTGAALQIGQLDAEGYQAVIQAIREYGQANILSSPRIAALNNEEAKILIGTNQPYATRAISQVSGGAANIEEENVTFLDLGVKLYVTPTINEDNYVTMKIKPEVSSQTGTYTIVSSGNTIPVIKTTTTETTVMVKDGATILIGGLIEETIQESVKEVPGFSSVPLLGNLFRSKTKGSSTIPEKTELVIFLTPRIISGDEPKGLLTVDKVAQDILLNKIKAEEKLTDADLKNLTTSTLSADDYYAIISSMITKEVEKYKPASPVYGEVIISFTLGRDGRLLSTPTLRRGDNKALSEIGIKGIIEAGPFPEFPDSLNKDKETFQIAISYE
jgi:type II secretory pathway component GspD/PulD (secretin)